MLKSLAIAALVFAVTLSSVSASAQSQGTGSSSGSSMNTQAPVTTPGTVVHGDIAGTVGLGMLGAEVGLLLPPLLKLHHQWWAWAVFPAVGAAGGAVAGIFAFDSNTSLAVTMPMIGAGFALALPAVVGALALKDWRESGELEQRVSAGGLIRISRNGGRLGVPSVVSAPVYSAAEMQRYGVNQRSSLRISLVSARF